MNIHEMTDSELCSRYRCMNYIGVPTDVQVSWNGPFISIIGIDGDDDDNDKKLVIRAADAPKLIELLQQAVKEHAAEIRKSLKEFERNASMGIIP